MDGMRIRLSGDLTAGLRKFVADIQEKAIRPAAYAAGQVFYNEMHIRVPVFQGKVPVNSKTGLPKVHPGQLKSAIYIWHDSRRSTQTRQIYIVSVNKRKAPHWHLVEYGTVKTPAYPYIRPTFDSKVFTAVDTAKITLAEKIKELS